MLKKIKKMQIFRHIVQLIMFILSPGLYILAFSEFKKIYQMIINGKFVFVQALPTLIEFTSVILLTVLLGRFFCGWVCTFGAYNDLVYLFSKKVFKVKFRVNEKVDSVLKYMKFVVLFMLMIVSWTIGSNIFNGTSPWDAFAQITDFSYVIANLLIGFILLILITIGAFFVERFFCRYLCPLGAIFTVCSKLSLFKINKPGEKCGKCRMCTMNCSMGLPLYTMESVRGGECINCLKCLEVCPRKNTKANIIDQDVTPALASSIAIATFVGVYGLTNVTGNILAEKGLTASADTNNSESKYKDGTYIGTGKGFRGGTTTISVTISEGKIASIDTVSQEDTPDFYEKAIGVISKEIISAQSAKVDVVSGATYSSNGIIEAVENALSQALLVPEAKETNNSDANKTVNNAAYKDGTYTGVGTGFNGATTKLSVTISGGKISNIETVSSGDTPDFYDRAIKIISKEILSAQSTEVDIVSGATYSSKGIIEAVQDALNQALGKPSSGKEAKVSENDNHNLSSNKAAIIDGNFADGTYTGIGTGFNGATTKVSVTISGGKIASIDTISNGDTPEFYERAVKVIPGKIISTQSTSVDVVSGATYSSKGIIQAVEDALSKASDKFKATIKPVSSGNNTSNGNNGNSGDDNGGIRIDPNAKFKDGTYTGTGTGFMGAKTNISVTISGGKIASIDTISNGDTPEFYEKAVKVIPSKIISAQSTKVDVVTGATYSSKGIIGAVNDALSKAVINPEPSPVPNPEPSPSPNPEPSPVPDKGYKDGTYTGTGTGFKGATTKISVIINGGKISKIETVSHGDTPRFYDKTIGTITNEIMEKQSTSVDVVSGATYSSNGIMAAVQDALNQASGKPGNNIPDKISYKDGTYAGTGTGFKGATTKISVTISGGKISKIETVSHGDTPRFYDKTIGTITNEIMEKQSTSVDVVSGATYSSKGIMAAVQDALNQASGKPGNNIPDKISYKDGTYAGTGTGFKGATTKISVTISGGKISKIETVSHGDTPRFYDKTIGTITNEIMEKQSTSVDVVSGATYSSKGIMAAVQDALNQASGKPGNNIPDKISYKDGTYAGTGTGFKGATTKISVTISGGKISKIETVSHGDTPRFYDKTIGTVTNEIMEKQSTSVDVVSGATYSSKGIMAAVQDALNQAK